MFNALDHKFWNLTNFLLLELLRKCNYRLSDFILLYI